MLLLYFVLQINRVRHAINLSLSSDQEWGKPAMKRIQEKARELLLKYVKNESIKNESLIPIIFFPFAV